LWEFRHPMRPPPLPLQDVTNSNEGVNLNDEGNDLGDHDGVHPGAATDQHLDSFFVFHRHINNRLLEQVRVQVEHMKSRMVRRVEWRVEQASILRQCFPPGESIRSQEFDAAGIEGMQLIFYPSGYTGAAEGYCSLFLFAPAGVTLILVVCWERTSGGQPLF